MSDPRKLLGGYATDTLREAERRELLRAALDDQELFEALMEEDGLRELLEGPGAREAVLAAVEAPTRWERVRGWLGRPATLADLALLGAALVIAAVAYHVFPGAEPSGGARPVAARPVATAVAPATLARLLALPPHETLPAALEPEGGAATRPWRVEPGATLALRATLRGPARVLLVAEGADGSALQACPPPGEPPRLVEAPAAGGPATLHLTATAARTPGPHRLRLVVAPLGVDLVGTPPAGSEPLLDRISLVDLTYEVATP
jgi:hypothetical protein